MSSSINNSNQQQTSNNSLQAKSVFKVLSKEEEEQRKNNSIQRAKNQLKHKKKFKRRDLKSDQNSELNVGRGGRNQMHNPEHNEDNEYNGKELNMNSDDDDQDQERMLEQMEIAKISQNYHGSRKNREKHKKKFENDDDADSDCEMRELMKDENCNPMAVEEFQMNGVRGIAYAAYQNEEITDFYKWNDMEGLNKKHPEDLELLEEISKSRAEPVMINEYDYECIKSDEEEDDELAFMGRFKAENLLYNVKKEIKIDYQESEDLAHFQTKSNYDQIQKLKNEKSMNQTLKPSLPVLNLGFNEHSTATQKSNQGNQQVINLNASVISNNSSSVSTDCSSSRSSLKKELPPKQTPNLQKQPNLLTNEISLNSSSNLTEISKQAGCAIQKISLPSDLMINKLTAQGQTLPVENYEEWKNDVRKNYASNFMSSGATIRINEDHVEKQREKGVFNNQLEADEPIDDNEQKSLFFQKSMAEFQDEMGSHSSATKEFTSLKHFKLKQQRHQPIKRDAVEACFERDLEVFRITKNFRRCLRWMIQKGMLPESRRCPCCDHQMRIINCHSKVKDGVLFKCSRLECRDVRISIREGTIFDQNHMTLMEILRCKRIQCTLDIQRPQGIQLALAAVYLGHFGRAVEIDESKFTHHTKGGVKSKVWVLGFYERGTKDVRAFVMKDRNDVSCIQLIRDNVEEGGEVYTDFWRGYNNCKDFYTHRVVNKAKYGYGTSEYQTTSRVESLWHILKRNIHTYSTIRASTLQRFLDEACWRIKFRTFTERNEFLLQLLNVTR
ncbi:UNKNOWN [Stylonychia lemnae]|uniref:ISXO2-like transposase domain-containing protein n=1 Tax=Stylonychia lemnae TaxID=5949 RepID=A0A078ATD1_STYLE|nr:UNKNOWN [Stylonychia lemnae]|eukprot:CDW84442.1 UNKNOWN [Stylonychia lemnae]